MSENPENGTQSAIGVPTPTHQVRPIIRRYVRVRLGHLVYTTVLLTAITLAVFWYMKSISIHSHYREREEMTRLIRAEVQQQFQQNQSAQPPMALIIPGPNNMPMNPLGPPGADPGGQNLPFCPEGMIPPTPQEWEDQSL